MKTRIYKLAVSDNIMELTEEQEKEIANKLIKQLSDFLVEADLDYEIKTWDNADGKDIIIKVYDEEKDETTKVKFAFRDNGFVSVDVENVE